MSECSSTERGKIVPRVEEPKRKCCLITPLEKCRPMRVCNVEIEVVMDDCSAGESTALLAVFVRKLNTDISSILLVHPVVRLAFLDTFASGNKRPARNAWTFLVQFIARGRQSLQLL